MLPDTGKLSYGGVIFDVLYHSKMSGKPEQDRAGRTNKYSSCTLEVEAHVTRGNNELTIDGRVLTMREILQKEGLQLVWTGKGYGPLIVNGVGASHVDVAWGPKPELFDFVPMGSGASALIRWRVTFRISPCAQVKMPRLLAFNWNSSIDMGEDRYCTWSMNGELEIAGTRNLDPRGNDLSDFDSIDQWRWVTEPRVPNGFRTVHSSRKTSDDKRILTFSYVYEELPPMGLPVNATDAGGNYSVKTVPNGKLYNPAFKWMATLRARYTIRPDAPRREAYLRFVGLFAARYSSHGFGLNPAPVQAGGGGGGGAGPVIGLAALAPGLAPLVGAFQIGGAIGGAINNAPPASVPNPDQSAAAAEAEKPGRGAQSVYSAPSSANQVPNSTVNYNIYEPERRAVAMFHSFGFDEGLYRDSKTTSFEASWILMTTFQSIFLASGAWRKMTDCRPDIWQNWMVDASGPDNWGHYYVDTSRDAIINACSSVATARPLEISYAGPRPGQSPYQMKMYMDDSLLKNHQLLGTQFDPDNRRSPERGIALDTMPDKSTSWLNYQCWFDTSLDPGTSLIKPLPQSDYDVDSLASVDAYDKNIQKILAPNGATNLRSKSGQSDYVVRSSTSTYKVELAGFGIRVGYEPPVPGLIQFGGVAAVPTKTQMSRTGIIDSYCGIPVYMTIWRLPYLLPTAPTNGQVGPPNPAAFTRARSSPQPGIQVPQSAPELDQVSRATTVLPTFIQGPGRGLSNAR